ncbi:MAG: diiron oxygenase [Actinomycetota bacterium]|nr:diiron oxygenase [Actinomycetota bacterium]
MAIQLEGSDRLREVLDRLVTMSKEDYYNPYQVFQWPDSLPEDQYWMSPELMSVHNTEAGKELTEEQLKAISKWESINFYSLNVDGIRELIVEIIGRIHTKDFAVSSEYFHHIIGEENEHMWFFATFCLNYGGKLYPDKGIKFEAEDHGEMDHFLVFARLLIFEEIVDFFNKKMGVDERLHPTIRQVNAIHHQDESRHVAFGRQIVSLLHSQLREKLDQETLTRIENNLKRYIRRSVESLVNPAAYRDAGIENPYALRTAVLADPAFHALEKQMLKRTMNFMVKEGIFTDDVLPAA